jgi:hypothetical protein
VLETLLSEIRTSPAVQADAHRLARRWQQWLYLECEYPDHSLL